MSIGDRIKPGTKLLMKSNISVCHCPICREYAGEIVTFEDWGSNLDERGNFFYIEEKRGQSLAFQNVEKIVFNVDIPEHLFEIEE